MGLPDGDSDGMFVGVTVGAGDGTGDGTAEGTSVGSEDGAVVGKDVGETLGAGVGESLGIDVGITVGNADGAVEGVNVGEAVVAGLQHSTDKGSLLQAAALAVHVAVQHTMPVYDDVSRTAVRGKLATSTTKVASSTTSMRDKRLAYCPSIDRALRRPPSKSSTRRTSKTFASNTS